VEQDVAKTILIVEDNTLNMKMLADLLGSQGYAVLQAEDGEPGFSMAKLHRPDLILMDIQLRDVSGLEVTRRLREDPETKDIPVVAVTAFAMRGDAERLLAGGCDGYVPKPISPKRFLDTVRDFIGPAN
jgi:two-component system, cell cycle response regulator DivK